MSRSKWRKPGPVQEPKPLTPRAYSETPARTADLRTEEILYKLLLDERRKNARQERVIENLREKLTRWYRLRKVQQVARRLQHAGKVNR